MHLIVIALFSLILAAPAAAEVTRIGPANSRGCVSQGIFSTRDHRFAPLRCELDDGSAEYIVYDLRRRESIPMFTLETPQLATLVRISPNGRYVLIDSMVSLTPEAQVFPHAIYSFDVKFGVMSKVVDDLLDIMGSDVCPKADIINPESRIARATTVSDTGVAMVRIGYGTATKACDDQFAVEVE